MKKTVVVVLRILGANKKNAALTGLVVWAIGTLLHQTVADGAVASGIGLMCSIGLALLGIESSANAD